MSPPSVETETTYWPGEGAGGRGVSYDCAESIDSLFRQKLITVLYGICSSIFRERSGHFGLSSVCMLS